MNENDVGHGSLGKARERRSANSPGYMGSITLKEPLQPGKYYLAAWVKTGDDGGQFFSLALSRPQNLTGPGRGAPIPPRAPQANQYREPPRQQSYGQQLDDEIPF